jgi:hypothetical protein
MDHQYQAGLYEMATEQKPFKGDNSVSVLSSILKDTPASVIDLNPALPPELARIIRRCVLAPGKAWNDQTPLFALSPSNTCR